jgi:arylsulfatase A
VLRLFRDLPAFLLLSAATACSTLPGAATTRPPRPPNIVFIMVDDLGSADLGCYGSSLIATPNLDRMAAEGIRFTGAYAGCTVCAPSRSALMTGYHTGHTAVRGNTGGIPLAADDLTFVRILKEAGYATGGFGKWGLGEVGTTGVPEKHGFDEFFGNYHQIHAHYYYTDYLYRNSRRVPLPGNEGYYEALPGPGPVPGINPRTSTHRQYAHNVMFERTLSFIRENRHRPFLCYAAWNPPHGRFEIPLEDPAWEIYKDESWPIETKVVAAMISMVDRQVGELLVLLAELGIADDTIVFFCSDNGGYQAVSGPLNRNGALRGGKGDLYEGGIRVPLIVRWPGKIDPARVSDHLCYFPDIMPTLAELAGASAAVPADRDGVSFVPTLLGAQPAGCGQTEHQYLYWEYTPYQWGKARYRPSGPIQALRMGDWKAVRQTMDAPVELYDLSVDAGEEHDVAARHPDIVARMEALLASARVEPRRQVEPERVDGRSFR